MKDSPSSATTWRLRHSVGADWSRLCRARDLCVDGDSVEVHFRAGRSHRVQVNDEGEALRLVGVVARATVVASLDDPFTDVWMRNCATALVGFRIDKRNWLIGEAFVPTAGLTAVEMQLCLRKVAAECDRLEFLLKGRDAE